MNQRNGGEKIDFSMPIEYAGGEPDSPFYLIDFFKAIAVVAVVGAIAVAAIGVFQ